jgi:ATP-dependent HslUV protease ATP-binding subunit HslU
VSDRDQEPGRERELTPRQIVAELDRDIVGQAAAKRAVAVALRNRWRRRQLPEELRRQVTPKNIMLIGPTGVGKTEIARRLAMLVGAPFMKAEATKYTEVGYVGRDVEGLIRDLVEAAIALVRNSERQRVEEQAKARVEQRLLDMLLPPAGPAAPAWSEGETPAPDEAVERRQRAREKLRARLAAGELDDREVEVTFPGRSMAPVSILGAGNFEQMEMDLQNMFEKIMPKPAQTRKMAIKRARPVLLQQEIDGLLDPEKISQAAVALAEESGIVFLDEIDKIAGEDSGSGRGPDVSRSGVQRDLLPIVEGTTVNTKHGPVKTDHILFVAAGAFHRSKPSDLMPELQGRFPIRVEMHDLTRDDFARILREPRASLIRQYEALLSTEGITLEFTEPSIELMADLAFQVNQSTQNIGARRLHTILERVLEEISYDAPNRDDKHVVIDDNLVRQRLEELTKDEDLSRFIL